MRALILVVILALSPPAFAQAARPSAEFVTLQTAVEHAYADRVRAMDLETTTVGAVHERMMEAVEAAARDVRPRLDGRWDVIRAESERQLALLETFDLAPYRGREPAYRYLPDSDEVGFTQLFQNAFAGMPEKLVVMRFYDPRLVARALGDAAIYSLEPDVTVRVLLQIYAPPRIYRAGWEEGEALVALTDHWVAVTPYSLTQQGLIAPAPSGVVVFARAN